MKLGTSRALEDSKIRTSSQLRASLSFVLIPSGPAFTDHLFTIQEASGDDVCGSGTRDEVDRAGGPPLDTFHDSHPPFLFSEGEGLTGSWGEKNV